MEKEHQATLVVRPLVRKNKTAAETYEKWDMTVVLKDPCEMILKFVERIRYDAR